MKLIGFSEGDHDPIVQLTDKEYKMLIHLQNAAAGERFPTWPPLIEHPQNDGDDIWSALRAVEEWVVAKYKINELKEHLDRLERVLCDE